MNDESIELLSERDDDSAHSYEAPSAEAVLRTARIFDALGEPGRLGVVLRLMSDEHCVSDLAAELHVELPVLSQRLKTLHLAGVLARRKRGRQVFYALADAHVATLVRNAFAPGGESVDQKRASRSAPPRPRICGRSRDDCSHFTVRHDEHTEHLHDRHLHATHEGQVRGSIVEMAVDSSSCAPGHDRETLDTSRTRGDNRGQEAVPHGDHVDHLVDVYRHQKHGETARIMAGSPSPA